MKIYIYKKKQTPCSTSTYQVGNIIYYMYVFYVPKSKQVPTSTEISHMNILTIAHPKNHTAKNLHLNMKSSALIIYQESIQRAIIIKAGDSKLSKRTENQD